MSELQKVVITRSRWDRCNPILGEPSDFGELLNRMGTLCCLGFLALQCLELDEDGIFEKPYPPYQTADVGWFYESAVRLNDNPRMLGCFTCEDQEARLANLFKENGFDLSFVD